MKTPPLLRAGLRTVPETWKASARRLTGRSKPWDVGARLSPPPLRAGQTIGAPDFVGVGAQKAGTSWWFTLLLAHPAIWHSSDIHKERHFFSRFAYERFSDEAVEQYHQWFPRPHGMRTGEWTPLYMAQFWTPGLLARAAPQTRVLVLLRDPVERFRSGLTHHQRRGLQGAGTASEAFLRGLYAEQLSWLLRAFRPEQILVLQYERCRRDPLGQLQRTYEFVGLEQYEPAGRFDRTVNKTPGEKIHLEEDVRALLVDLYTDDVRRLSGLVPELDLTLWPHFASLA